MTKKSLGADAAAGETARQEVSDAATARHTEGPWRVNPAYDIPAVIANCFPKGSTCVAVVYGDGAPEIMARVIASPGLPVMPNAHLIAAAPEMYEALKSIAGCKAFTCDCGIPEEVFDSVEAALAKAEGR